MTEPEITSAERVGRIIQETFFPYPPTRWETMSPSQRQDFIDCAQEVMAALVGDVLTVSQQGPVVRLDYGKAEEARAAYYALGEAGNLNAPTKGEERT